MEKAATGGRTLRRAFRVRVRVDVNAFRGALQEPRVLDGPAHDVDVDRVVREAVVSV